MPLTLCMCSPQTGLYEMKDMAAMSGGQVVQIDTFTNPVFKESLKRLFVGETEPGFLGMSSNATLEVLPSRDIKVSGLLGPAAKLDKKGPAVHETEVIGPWEPPVHVCWREGGAAELHGARSPVNSRVNHGPCGILGWAQNWRAET
jgi:hypothetical protein